MSLRSKVVIESNLKPSKFGKPALMSVNNNVTAGVTGSSSDIKRTSNGETAMINNDNNNYNNNNNNNNNNVNNDDENFEEIYENPLEKVKPLPPRIDELPRNDTETMEFSNASIKNNLINDINNLSIENNNNQSNLTNVNNKDDRKSANYSSNDRNSNGFYNNNNNNGNNNSNYNNSNNGGNRDSRIRSNDYNNSQGFVNEGVDDNNTRTVIVNEKLVSLENQSMQSGSNSNNNNNNNNDDNNNNNSKNEVVQDKPDISLAEVATNIVKSMDVNRYATKKTIAQGMLDIALLTANASQLKYILQIGQQHEFYILMLSLICVSIGLQVLHGIVCILLGSTCNLNKPRDHKKSNVWNNIALILMILTVGVNAVISAFDMRDNSALTKANLTTGTAANIRTASGGR